MERSVTGVVTRVGGERFELSDDAQQAHVFTLALDASVDGGELAELQRDGTRVTVEYDDDTPEATVRVAHRVSPVGAPNRPV